MKHTSIARRVTPLAWTLGLLWAFATSAEAVTSPEAMLEGTSQKLFDVIRQEREVIRTTPTRMFEVVEEVLVPHVDMLRMSRLVLGKNWRKANGQQQQRFTREFQSLLVRFYTSALLDEESTQLDKLLDAADKDLITFQPATLSPDGRQAIVRSEVRVPEGAVIPVNFRLYKGTGETEWKVIDLTVEGISLVTNYRSSFSTEIRSDGIDGMLNKLAQRNRELMDQAKNGGKGAAAPGAR